MPSSPSYRVLQALEILIMPIAHSACTLGLHFFTVGTLVWEIGLMILIEKHGCIAADIY